MADPIPQIRFSPGVKRSHDQFVDTRLDQSASTTFKRETSPAPSTISSLSELTATTPQPQLLPTTLTPVTANSGDSPTKKRKLTFAERQVEFAVQKVVKEEKAKVKAQEKAEKEEKKRQKDEEKRKKAEEKEAENRQKEMKKAEKDAEKAKKDAEKAKKDAEKAKKDAEKAEKQAAKDAERIRKEQEKMQKEQEKVKKERVCSISFSHSVLEILTFAGSNAAGGLLQSSSTGFDSTHDTRQCVGRRCV
jgi:uncharacterized membrane protein YqiK